MTSNTFDNNAGTGVYVYNGGLPIITNNTFSNNATLSSSYYGLHIGASAVQQTSGNTFSGSDANNTIRVDSGTVSNSGTWRNQGAIYYVHGNVDVRGDANPTLTIEPGITFQFRKGSGRLQIGGGGKPGKIVADASGGDPIIFTSYETAPAPQDWYGIFFDPAADDSSVLNNVVVEYAGRRYGNWGGYYWYGNINILHSNPTISNSTIRYGDRGIQTRQSSSQIHNSSICGNTTYGVYNMSTDHVVDARYNWWGDASGPAPFGSGDAINGRYTCTPPPCHYEYDIVLVNPWQGSPGATSYNSSSSTEWSAWEAEPVNVVFGNYVYQHTDLPFPGRGLDFAFQRTYNSNVTDAGPLGVGWTHSYNITATEITTDTVVVRRADGRLDQYIWQGSAYTPPPGSHDQLAEVGSTFVLTQTDQTVLTFDAQGRLASMKDRNGNTMTFGYSGGNLTTITLPDGRTVTLTYSGNRLTSLTDPAGRTVGFGYTGDYLTVVTDARGFTTTYAYDAQGRLQSITDANSHTFVQNTYNTDSRVVQQRDALNNLTTFTYYTATRRTVVVDPLGHAVTYTYDSAYRITGEQDALGHQVTYKWDADNNRTQVTDKRGNTTRYAYDNQGNVTVITDTLGFTRTFTYDARNNPTSETNPLDHTTVYTYDVNGNLIARADPLGNTTTFAYDGFGQMTITTDANGNTMQYQYDTYGHQTVITDALGNATIFTYDNVGRMLSETNPLGRTTSYTYDTANRPLTVTDPLGGVTSYTYDAVGNRIAMQDALGRVTQYGYDAKDRLVSVTDPLGNTTTYTYDANDNKATMVDPKGQTIIYAYDALNRLTGITYPTFSVGYAYDANGNRTSMTDPTGTTTYAYDTLNRLTSVTGGGQTVSYQYDVAGNRTHLTYPDGKQVTYGYDALNRLITLTDWVSRTTAYTYDAVGNPVTLAYPNGTNTAYAYDALSRLLVITHTSTVSGTLATFHYTLDALGHRTQMADADGTTSYAYDPLSRLTQVAYPNGEAVTYAYDVAGNRTAMTSTVSGVVTYTYDAGDRLLSVGSTTATWDANGNMLTKGSTAYTYDAANRLTQVVSGTTTVQFTYDGDSNRASKTVNGTTTSYLYDLNLPLPQLLVETTGGQNTLYLYGADLIAYIAPDGTPIYYHHDGLGSIRLLSNTSGQSTASYAYDVFGALRSATGSATNHFLFTGEQSDDETGLVYLRTRYYDPALGRFITRDYFPGFAEAPQSLNRYVYCQNDPVNLTDPSGEIAIVPFLTMYAGNTVKSVAMAEARLLVRDVVHTYEHYERTGEWAFQPSGERAYLDGAKEGLKWGIALGWIPGEAGEIIRGIRSQCKWATALWSLLEVRPVGEVYDPFLRPYSGFGALLGKGKAARAIQPPSQPK